MEEYPSICISSLAVQLYRRDFLDVYIMVLYERVNELAINYTSENNIDTDGLRKSFVAVVLNLLAIVVQWKYLPTVCCIRFVYLSCKCLGMLSAIFIWRHR